METNEKDVRRFYQYFNHDNPTEIRVFDEQKYPNGKTIFIKSEEEFVKQVTKYQKEGVDVYIGFRDRTAKGDKNVTYSQEIFFEIDEHDIKKPEEKIKVEKFLKKNNIEIGMLGFSGGGFHYYIPHMKKIFEIEEDRDFYKRVLAAFKEALLDYGIDIDAKVFNLERVSRILGTYNHKRKQLSKILIYNKNIKTKENHAAIKKLIAKYEKKKIKVDESAIELLKKYKINKNHKWLYDLLKKGIVVKADTGGNSIVLKNTAIILTGENIPNEEAEIIGKAIIELCEDRNLTQLYSWIKKCEENDIFEVYKNELNKFIKDNNYDLTPYRLSKKDKERIREYKTDKEQDKAKSFLQEDRLRYESLGCGYHNGVFYFGTKLFRDGKGYTAVVTSNKKIYVNTLQKIKDEFIGENQIKTLFGLNYKDNFFDESLDNIFSREAIYKWVYEDTKNITLKSVYNKLVKLFKKYVYFEDKRKYSLLACYRIASFFMPVWKVRARLFLWAEMGSAKSRLTQMLHNTGFNSIALGDWTLAYIKTIIESTRGETHIDDYETLDDEKKKATERQIKVGFMKGFKAGKMSEGKRKPEVNDLFNTTTLNNTEGLNFITSDRCIPIRIPKIAKQEYDEEPRFEQPIYKDLRDNLYILGLKYPEIVKKCYEKLKSERIRGRLFSIIKPDLTIARLISKDIYNDIEDFWEEEILQRRNIDYETDWEFLAFKEIYKLLSPHSTLSTNSTLSTLSPFTFYVKDITNKITEELYSNLEKPDKAKKKRGIGIFIGNQLSRSPIFKKGLTHGTTRYEVKPIEFISLLKAKGFFNVIEDIIKEERGERVDRGGGKTTGDTE